MRILSFTILVLLLLPAGKASYNPNLEFKIDTHQILIGDQIDLHFNFTKPDDGTLLIPQFEKNLTEDIEIIKQHLDSLRIAKDNYQYAYILRVTSFTTGNHFIPKLPFIYGSDTFYSAESYLEVLPVAVDTTNTIRDIKAVETPPITLRDVLPWVIVCLVLALISGTIYLLRKHKKGSRNSLEPNRPLEPAYVIALRELDRLKSEKLWQQNQIKEYYTQLTQIIRAYIELQFSLPALEQTTNEILHSFDSKEYRNKINYNSLSDLLNLADMVKFAKEDPLPDENIRLLDTAYQFVSTTKELAQTDFTDEQQVKELVTESVQQFYSKLRNVKHLRPEQVADRIIEGGKLIQFEYCISIIVMTFTLYSGVYLIEQHQSTKQYSLPFNLATILLGWWGIPWGPIRSVKALRTNSNGGKQIN